MNLSSSYRSIDLNLNSDTSQDDAIQINYKILSDNIINNLQILNDIKHPPIWSLKPIVFLTIVGLLQIITINVFIITRFTSDVW